MTLGERELAQRLDAQRDGAPGPFALLCEHSQPSATVLSHRARQIQHDAHANRVEDAENRSSSASTVVRSWGRSSWKLYSRRGSPSCRADRTATRSAGNSRFEGHGPASTTPATRVRHVRRQMPARVVGMTDRLLPFWSCGSRIALIWASVTRREPRASEWPIGLWQPSDGGWGLCGSGDAGQRVGPVRAACKAVDAARSHTLPERRVAPGSRDSRDSRYPRS